MYRSKLLGHLAEIFHRRSTAEQQAARNTFLKKYQSFQALLTNNNAVLEFIAGIEEKMSAQSSGYGDYMERTIMAIAEGAQKVANHLNLISGDAYPELNKRVGEINAELVMLFTGREVFLQLRRCFRRNNNFTPAQG